MNIGIYIYDEAEVLDFSGPFEVFSTASRISPSSAPFNTLLIGETGGAVDARGGFRVVPHHGFHNHPPLELLIISGGVYTEERHKPNVLQWIEQQSNRVQIIASVCTGAFILAEAGILTNHKVTTHWEDIPSLAEEYPQLQLLHHTRWVDEGEIITSGGISAGIDMSLHLVSRLTSEALAIKTARQMAFDWSKSADIV